MASSQSRPKQDLSAKNSRWSVFVTNWCAGVAHSQAILECRCLSFADVGGRRKSSPKGAGGGERCTVPQALRQVQSESPGGHGRRSEVVREGCVV